MSPPIKPQLDSGKLISGFTLSDNWLAWTAEEDGRYPLFVQRIGDATPTRIMSDMGNSVLVADQLIYQEGSGNEDGKLIQRDLTTGRTTFLADNPIYVTSDGTNVCWTAATNDERSNRQIFCRGLTSEETVTLPFTYAGISSLNLTKGNLVWTESALPNPSSPRTLYAASLRDLLAVINPPPSGPPAQGDAGAFERLWNRHDLPVSEGRVDRSWTWGPKVIAEMPEEPYAEGVNGKRIVSYHEKSRMEINDPKADPNAAWYITNGLLPVELISGRLQTGNTRFEQRLPAQITAVGDPDQFPTYADLGKVYQSPGQVNPTDIGKAATGLLNPDGSISSFNEFASDPNTMLVQGENGHGVARAFITFMNQEGGMYIGGRLQVARLYDPTFVFGLPITGAYWVKARVGGVERLVLFQCFERRCLTYNPANPVNWRVEMGNVGRHYYEWRYGAQR